MRPATCFQLRSVHGLVDFIKKRSQIALLPAGGWRVRSFVCFFVRSFVAGICLILVGACVDSQKLKGLNEEQVFRLPWPDPNGGYSLQDIKLKTFSSPATMEGELAKVYVNPMVVNSEQRGKADITSQIPVAQWIREGQRMVPLDYTTLQAAVIYAHIEKLDDLAKELGLSSQEKIKVGLQAKLVDSTNFNPLLNNAIYDSRVDVLFFVPFTDDGLPIPVNAGIVAHEVFHRLYQKNVLGRAERGLSRLGVSLEQFFLDKIANLAEEDKEGSLVPRLIWNQTLLRGVNEGLADFWGWAYSKDELFIGRSLGRDENENRTLQKKIRLFPTAVSFQNQFITVSGEGAPVLKSSKGRTAVAYQMGTDYARALRGFADIAGPHTVQLAIVQSFKAVADLIVDSWESRKIDPQEILLFVLDKILSLEEAGQAENRKLSGSVKERVHAICVEAARVKLDDSRLRSSCEAGHNE